jgi:hypothetical protein
MAYATVAELRAEVNKTDTGDDTTLARLLDAASQGIDRVCNRPDGFVAGTQGTARTYRGSGNNWIWIDECVEVETVKTKSDATASYETWAATDYIACTGDPLDPNYNKTPYTALFVDPNGEFTIFYADGVYPTVEVTAKWGYAVLVPPAIKTACIMQAARWYKRLQGAMSDSLTTTELGTMFYTKSLDPDIKRLLVDGRFVRPSAWHR